MLRSLPRFILALWIAAGCPALCALRASSDTQLGPDGCCDHRQRGEPAESDPAHPPVPACNPCLCAGQVVVPDKPIVAEPLMPALLTTSGLFTLFDAPAAHGPLAAFVSPSPPEPERTLPLLI